MSVPSEANGYQAGPGLVVTRAIWNAVFASINQRISAREALESSFNQLIEEGTALAIQSIQENLGPQLSTIATQITSLQALIIAAEDAVAVLIAGNIPAENVVFTPAAGISATRVHTALAELAGMISTLSSSVTAQIAATRRITARTTYLSGF